MSRTRALRLAIAAAGAGAAIAAALAWYALGTPDLGFLGDAARLRSSLDELGAWGPLAMIGLMALAVVVSPIPSGPIAMAAGALWGPIWGGALVVVGAQIGAMTAFALARRFGYGLVRQSPNRALQFLSRPHPQHVLMGVIFLSRLAPFISFDAVSYAAGLTSITFWRFAIASCLGVAPISFALAYLGEATLALPGYGAIALLAGACALTAGPLLAAWLWPRRSPP